MKFNYNILALSLLGTMAVACDPMEDIYDEIDAEQTVITKSEDEYVMTKADYEAIAKKALKDAKTKSDSTWANKVKSDQALNEVVTPEKYVPGMIAKLYPTWGKGSTVGVTFKYRLPYDNDRKVNNYKGIKSSYVSDSDYEAVWEEDGFAGAEYFAPKHPAAEYLPTLLADKFAGAKKYDKVLIDYKTAEQNPSVEVGEDLFAEEFANVEVDAPIAVEGWKQIQLAGDRTWSGKSYNDNGYAQMSAHKAKGKQEVALITPAVAITNADANLTFDVKFGFYKGECLTVYVREAMDSVTFDAAEWTDVTAKFTFPKGNAGGYTDMVNAGSTSMASYNGKNVQFAFVYRGAGEDVTTTVQVDNVKVTSTKISHPKTQKQSTLYVFDGEKWDVCADKDVVVVTPADYDAMGAPGKHDNFSDSDKASNYVPQLLTAKFPYAQNGDVKVVVYKFYKNKETKIYVDEYQYEGAWSYLPGTLFETRVKEAFLHNGEEWLYDPTVRISVSEADYQLLATWTNENKPGYVDSKHNDSEYWFGASVHYKNFNVQLVKRRSYDPEKVIPANDAEAKKYLDEMIGKGIEMILAHNYPNAQTQANGLDLYYAVSCKVYDGDTNFKYTYRFQSLGNGKFKLAEAPQIEMW